MLKKIIWAVLGLIFVGILLLGVLALVGNFSMARNQTETNVTVASSRWPQGAALSAQPLTVRVEGESALAESLAAALPQQGAYLDLMTTDAAETAVPDVIVQIDAARVNWTPVHAAATVNVTAGFSSNGDFQFLAQRPTHFQFEADDADDVDQIVQAVVEIELIDESNGLLSRRGYRDQLAESIVAALDDALQAHVFAAP